MNVISKRVSIFGIIAFAVISASFLGAAKPQFVKRKTRKGKVYLDRNSVIPSKSDLNFGKLLAELARYKTINIGWHEGNLYEHSVWTALTIAQWFDEGHFWTEGLDPENDRKLCVLAGLLHDLGKAGDEDYIFHDKKNHPSKGFEYLTGTKKFTRSNGKTFDLERWCERLGLSAKEKATIAIINGIHWDFGGKLLKGRYERKKTDDQLAQEYLDKLQFFATKAGYPGGKIDKKLLMIALLVSAADVKGARKVFYKSKLFPELKSDRSHYQVRNKKPIKGKNKYKEYSFEIFGKQARDHLLHYFEHEVDTVVPQRSMEKSKVKQIRSKL